MKKEFEKIIEKLEEYRNLNKKYEEIDFFDGENSGINYAIKIVEEVAERYNNGWIPVYEKLPDNGKNILLSFENFAISPQIGRYIEDEEGGAFYLDDDIRSCSSIGLFVNAWQPMPETYKKKLKEMESE